MTGIAPHSAWFRRVLGHFPTGVVIVTAIHDGAPAGMSIGSFTGVSEDPPLIAILPAKTSTSWPRIAAAGAFCVNILNARQEALCRTFATSGADKFAGVSWQAAPSGAPVLAGALAWIDCALGQVVEAGDHFIALGQVRSLDVSDDQIAEPLVFFQGGYGTVSRHLRQLRRAPAGPVPERLA
jgi:flavin reductase (DIM6/NTAB) family NADH-FMN oxidoreductase RutF